MASRYHLYQRTVHQRDGSTFKVWYYWFAGPDGGPIRRSTGCELKREAEDFIEALELQDEATARLATHPRARVLDVAGEMYTPDAGHLKRWALKGRTMVEHTRLEYRRNLEAYILPAWGECWIDEIRGPEIEDWLVSLRQIKTGQPFAGSTLNGIGLTFISVFEEARRSGFVEAVPDLELFARRGQRKDVLLDAELETLFPTDSASMAAIWCRRQKAPRPPRAPGLRPFYGRPAEDAEVGIMFGTMFALAASAGLRPGEVRAVHLDQLYHDAGGMIVDRAYDDAGVLGPPKKSRDGDPRYRVVYVPDRTWELLDTWIPLRKESEKCPGLLFPFHGHAVAKAFFVRRFAIGLSNAGIPLTGRNLTPHSLRYTYDTKMRGLLSGDVLREFIGHRSEAMTDHYDRATLRPVLEARLLQLADNRPAVERFWSN